MMDNPNLGDVCAEVAKLAEKQFHRAQDLIDACEPKLIRPAVIMKTVYYSIFQKLCARGWNKLDQPVGPSKIQKALLVLKVSVLGK